MKRARVLIVEDNPADAAYARAILDGDFSVTAATRLRDAVDAVGARPYDVAILDMSLPDVEGLDALARLQEVAPHLPVVILSGDDDDKIATAAVQAGAQDYLVKGHVTDVALKRAVRYAIERQELRDRLAASIDELERQRASVLELNQLKNDLIAVLAHDIKGPLTSIIGFAELLEEGFLEGEGATDAARTIRTNAQRLATLANDVLALSRVEHGELEIADERVDVLEVIRSVIELHEAERQIVLTAAVDEACVRGDADRLRQVFDNLVRNAIKYSPNGEPVEIALSSDGDVFRIDVRDRGMGIPADELPKLFERFSRASNARRAKIPGTGIGLFIVRMIVERHGGSISVESRLDSGSSFVTTLPNIRAESGAPADRVTVLSGDRDLRRFAAYELRTRGYRVREFASLDELLNVGDVRAGDIILADGSASSDEIRSAFTAPLRLIGIATEPTGWDAVLPKPFLVTDLLEAVRGAVPLVPQ